MLSATLYRFRKDLAKKPWVMVLVVIAVLFSCLMVAIPSLSSEALEIERNNTLIIGSINILLIIMMDFMFMSGLKNGVVGFTYADVNFHLAGPFTQKFNLILAATGIFKVCAIFLWVLCCQSSVLSTSLGLNSWDMVGLILGSIVVVSVGYLFGAFLGAYYNDSENAIRNIQICLYAVNGLVVAANAFLLYRTYGSIEAIMALGAKGIIASVGSSMITQIFPVAGWTNLIYSGILLSDKVYIIIGLLLVIASIVAVIVLYVKVDVDYYEAAMTGAQKVADAQEAKRAGLNTDTSNINRKIRVGKETLSGGWGASAFMHRHLLENKRATKFFFVNPLTVLYRIMTVVYMAMMTKIGDTSDSPQMGLFMALMMMVMLNAMIYGGGKTILEFNRPFIFLVPEKGSKKLMSCLLSELPEMLFDSVVCGIILGVFVQLSVVECVCAGIMMIVFDLLFEMVALISLRIFKSLGRVLLVMVRTFIGYGIVMIAFVPGIVAFYMTNTLISMFVIAAIVGAVMVGVLFAFARNIVDNVEMT